MEKKLNLMILWRLSPWMKKILLYMKLTCTLLLLGIVSVFAEISVAQTSNLSVNFKNATVESVLQSVEEQSDYYFLYSRSMVDVNRKVDIHLTHSDVSDILKVLFDETNVSYKIEGRQIVLSGAEAFAGQQEVTITGQVTDEDGLPLPGVSIFVKGTTIGITSDFDGNYSLKVPAETKVLVFSFVGLKTEEIALNGKTTINVVLREEGLNVDEVVVTALGISRKKKALGYAVQEVDGNVVSESSEIDIVNSLAGRISGVHITQGDGSVGGGGSRIVIRGETSLAGNNEPLYIIDGIPAESLNDIASDDIESISVLKGPAASALYGSRAGAGVIIVTTKSGPKNGKVTVEINSGLIIQTPAFIPDVQKEYGQGSGLAYSNSEKKSWGPSFADNSEVEQLWGVNEWMPYSPMEDFYQTGIIQSNNVAISSGTETSSFRLSLSNLEQTGIEPETEYSEKRFDLTNNWSLLDNKLRIKTNVKYARTGSDNDGESYNGSPYYAPANVNYNALEDYWTEENVSQREWLTNSNNEYFLLNENVRSWDKDNFVASASIDYNIAKNLNIMLRGGYNGYSKTREQRQQFGTEGESNKYGSYNLNETNKYEINTDFLATYKKQIGSDISLVTSVGGNMMSSSNEWLQSDNSSLLVANIYTLANHRVFTTSTNSSQEYKTNAIYAFANLGYKDIVYLDITARNDWTSTLSYKENDSYFYPSASLSVLVNKIFELPKTFDLLKLKANYAEVGNATDPYMTLQSFSFNEGSEGVAGIEQESTKIAEDLKPEFSKSFELGLQGVMFNNRLDFDVTAYLVNTENQIWNMSASRVSGYESIMMNIGSVESKGLEVSITGVPIKTRDFKWTSSVNWSMDRSQLTELDPDDPEFFISNKITGHLYAYDKVNERRGTLYSRTARTFKYDAEIHDTSLEQYNGQLYFDGSADLPRDDFQVVGNYNPDWIGSWYNEFRYRNISVSALLFANVGNEVYNSVEKYMVEYGLDKRTVEGRIGGVIPEGVWEFEEGNAKPFEAGEEVDAENYWSDFMVDGENSNLWVKDGSFLKLKQLTVAYDLPKNILNRTPFKGVKVSFTGRNLFTWTKIKHTDPESYITSGGIAYPGMLNGTEPTLKSYAFNLKIVF